LGCFIDFNKLKFEQKAEPGLLSLFPTKRSRDFIRNFLRIKNLVDVIVYSEGLHIIEARRA